VISQLTAIEKWKMKRAHSTSSWLAALRLERLAAISQELYFQVRVAIDGLACRKYPSHFRFGIVQHQRDANGRATLASDHRVIGSDPRKIAVLDHRDVERHQQACIILGQDRAPGFELAPDNQNRVSSACHPDALLKLAMEWDLGNNIEVFPSQSGS
jgi:hypothetical protein